MAQSQGHPSSTTSGLPSGAKRVQGWFAGQGMAIISWLIALISMIVAIVALLPGFHSQKLSQMALDLAEWTALKDYLDRCKAELLAQFPQNAEMQRGSRSLRLRTSNSGRPNLIPLITLIHVLFMKFWLQKPFMNLIFLDFSSHS
ncbi:hypothetical protein B0T10DRAFT_50917 [Thelonectria olida]|uniref:Uncharacterized protein n=1 Tax=Thelonectria olida TaxID=1576542 RepID=A0A9P8W6K6_9HYPO|nr:hypothetical protein B0T10DRAFT_50917 [Thelonectria olida]